jgi:hypothetical protein
VTGVILPAGEVLAVDFTLTVTGSSGALRGATGTLDFAGSFPSGAQSASGKLTGALTLPSSTPKSKDECKNGGWRNLVDDQGQPFRNQGQCVSWAVHHVR